MENAGELIFHVKIGLVFRSNISDHQRPNSQPQNKDLNWVTTFSTALLRVRSGRFYNVLYLAKDN